MKRVRAAVTLIEFLVVFALLSLFSSLVWDLWIGSNRQAKQVEEGTDLIRSALLLQEYLTSDLERALPLRTFPPDLAPRGKAMDRVSLPIYAGYRGDSENAIRFRAVEYRWDPGTHSVLRDGRKLVEDGISELSFRWTDEVPTMLQVEIEGEKSFKESGTRFSIHLPAPQGTDGLPIWVFAPHHLQAEAAETP